MHIQPFHLKYSIPPLILNIPLDITLLLKSGLIVLNFFYVLMPASSQTRLKYLIGSSFKGS
jgi:hypothetical protein